MTTTLRKHKRNEVCENRYFCLIQKIEAFSVRFSTKCSIFFLFRETPMQGFVIERKIAATEQYCNFARRGHFRRCCAHSSDSATTTEAQFRWRHCQRGRHCCRRRFRFTWRRSFGERVASRFPTDAPLGRWWRKERQRGTTK